jgi:hypothetical protein
VSPLTDSDSTISSTPVQTTLPLTDDLWLEGAGNVSGYLHLDRADISQHGLGPRALLIIRSAVSFTVPIRLRVG